MRILYLGSRSGTSLHRAAALERLGHTVTLIDPRELLLSSRVIDKWIWETGGLLLEDYVRRRVLSLIGQGRFELVWVDAGELVGPALLRALKEQCGTILNYNMDNPYTPRDRNKWRLYHQALPLYDLVVVVRQSNVPEAMAAGARRALAVSRSADEVAHARRDLSEAERLKWSCEVAFIGTWMPERGPFLAELARRGVPLSIWGDRWHKASEWSVLRQHWRGNGLYDGHDYARAVQSAKVCLGLLSKGNLDQTTVRSFEAPFLGTVLCAERTAEHRQLYDEDLEAVFWSTPEECARKCEWLLENPELRNRIAMRGRARCLRNGTTNERVLEQILEACCLASPCEVVR